MKPDFESQATEYDAIWAHRHQTPIILESWTDNDWAKGRTEYLAILIKVDQPTILEKVKPVQDKLAQFRCVDVLPLDYMHLTVKETGCFLVGEKTGENEYMESELESLKSGLKRVIDGYSCFDVKLERLNNFKSVICVEAHDGGIIRGINARLRELIGLPTLTHDPKFLPHMSITQYKSEKDYAELINYLESSRNTCIDVLHVDCIHLVLAHLPSEGRYPKIEILEEYPLKD